MMSSRDVFVTIRLTHEEAEAIHEWICKQVGSVATEVRQLQNTIYSSL